MSSDKPATKKTTATTPFGMAEVTYSPRAGMVEIVGGWDFAPGPPSEPVTPRRTRRHHADKRKLFVSVLKAEHPGITFDEICAALDDKIDRLKTANEKKALAPLESWTEKSTARMWAVLLKDTETHRSVRRYLKAIAPAR
jgi:hypothetical protein